MAIGKFPIGSLSGKVGNLRFAASGAETIVASQPSGYTDAGSPTQIEQRTKLTTCVMFAKLCLGFIAMSLKGAAKRVSGYNTFVSLNVDKIANDGNFRDTNFADVVMSKGPVLSPSTAVATATNNGGDITIGYTPNVNGTNGLATDKLMFVAVDSVNEIVTNGYTGYTRNASAGSKTVSGSIVNNDTFDQVYFYFQSSDGRSFSNSIAFANV